MVKNKCRRPTKSLSDLQLVGLVKNHYTCYFLQWLFIVKNFFLCFEFWKLLFISECMLALKIIIIKKQNSGNLIKRWDHQTSNEIRGLSSKMMMGRRVLVVENYKHMGKLKCGGKAKYFTKCVLAILHSWIVCVCVYI